MILKPYLNKDLIEAGCDEVGRGCLAGPVVAAAVILDNSVVIDGLNDSKKLSEKRRDELAEEIKDKALFYSIQEVGARRIEKINILHASIEAMHLALKDLKQQPEFILVDGNKFKPYGKTPYTCVIKGDGKYMSIAAASILAKTYRDNLMKELHQKWPNYGWDTNMGYPTKKHRDGIRKYGTTKWHRTTFNLLGNDEQLKLSI